MGGAGRRERGDTGIWREQHPGTLGCRDRGTWGQQGQADPLPHIPTPQSTEVAVPEGEQPASGAGGQGRLQQPMPLILCTFQREPQGARRGGSRGGLQDPLPPPASPTGPSYFQLRCYLFQALELVPHGTKTTAGGTPPLPGTPDPPSRHPGVLMVGAAPTDPVAHVSFVHVSQSTRVLARTLDPRWDQALLFHRVLLYGDPRGVRDEPPAVVVEVFDKEGEVRWGGEAPMGAGHQWVGGTHALALSCRVLAACWGGVCAPRMCGWIWGAGSPPGCDVTRWRGRGGRRGSCWLPSSCCTRLR